MRELEKTKDEKENYIEAFYSAGYLIGEVVNIKSDEKFLIKVSSG